MNRAGTAYVRRFLIVMTAYVALLLAGIALVNHLDAHSPWRYLAMLLPVPAVFGVVWVVLRYLRESDEFVSRSTTEGIAIGFAGGSATTFTYGLLQFAGAPQVNWTIVWVVYGAWWLVGTLVVRRHYR